jgi:hypothetical protein
LQHIQDGVFYTQKGNKIVTLLLFIGKPGKTGEIGEKVCILQK